MWNEALDEQADALAQGVATMTRSHAGRLTALTITAPAAVRDVIGPLFDQHLAVAGIDFVDLSIEPAEGPLRVVKAEFER